jgi:hypothetical protein
MEIVESDSLIKHQPHKKERPYIEQFVDKGYERDTITTKCAIFFQDVKARFKDSKDVISFEDIADLAQEKGYSYYAAVQWMRMLWKAGKVRRFVKGEWYNTVQGNSTGRWFGVGYSFK